MKTAILNHGLVSIHGVIQIDDSAVSFDYSYGDMIISLKKLNGFFL